ncbi:MAG: glycosyltransferase family 4 protein [Candidatus Dormibacteraeota bacterium]|nr:glycosyltransferase family 4 protein [Candidatus Dormibacteraeota bacterium]
MTYPATAAERMARSRGVVDALLDSAHAHVSQGHVSAAVALLSAAATVSRRRHTGLFTNLTLESKLSAVGTAVHAQANHAQQPESMRSRHRTPGGVLHVMTRGYAAGGHTRLVERWIDSEPDVVSSVAFTQDCDAELGGLRAAVERSGGVVHRLHGSSLERIRQLAALTAERDRIVLSIHENDAVALLALTGLRRRAPVVVLNHAEHVFWAGASLADVLVTFRPASTDLAVARRGIARASCIEIPLPVASRRRQQPTGEARRTLGIDPADKVLLTIGWRYKFTPYAGDDLIQVLAPILDDSDVHLVAVGPRADDKLWSEAHARYAGRVHPVGRQDDVQCHLDAADVLLDSYPIASLTALLEAAMLGLPVVGLAPRDSRWPRILREDDPALADEMFDDADAYRARIRALLRDPAVWRDASHTLRERARRTHRPEAWAPAMRQLHELASRAARTPRQPPSPMQLGEPSTEDSILATYIADCEDTLVRPELRLKPGLSERDEPELTQVSERIAGIDRLLMGPSAPGAADYDEALRLAREPVPDRAVLQP